MGEIYSRGQFGIPVKRCISKEEEERGEVKDGRIEKEKKDEEESRKGKQKGEKKDWFSEQNIEKCKGEIDQNAKKTEGKNR